MMVHMTAGWRTFWLQDFLSGSAGDRPERIRHNFWGAVQRSLVYSAPVALPSAMLHAHTVDSGAFHCRKDLSLGHKTSLALRGMGSSRGATYFRSDK